MSSLRSIHGSHHLRKFYVHLTNFHCYVFSSSRFLNLFPSQHVSYRFQILILVIVLNHVSSCIHKMYDLFPWTLHGHRYLCTFLMHLVLFKFFDIESSIGLHIGKRQVYKLDSFLSFNMNYNQFLQNIFNACVVKISNSSVPDAHAEKSGNRCTFDI